MLLVGLTGGIGSGKSSVAAYFTARGVPVIDADVIAKKITQKGETAYQKIVEHLGEHILLADGSLNRAALKQLIFEDPKERIWLENLLHPIIRSCIEQGIRELSAPYCIIVIPLLYETHSPPFIQRVLVVDTSESLQKQRVADRDKLPEKQIEAILQTQVTRKDRLQRCDDIIHNDGSLKELEAEVEKLHQQYLSLSQ
ncbi:MAG TPA: dephospho-CoA kinase [Gammaproteobacteria bacterium]|jgi:dephospho-CoA kinase|nr:dephospho-CoA kinase [Gammaproteobacteria bacterium]